MGWGSDRSISIGVVIGCMGMGEILGFLEGGVPKFRVRWTSLFVCEETMRKA